MRNYTKRFNRPARIEKPEVKKDFTVAKDGRLLPTKPVKKHLWKSGKNGGFKYDSMDKQLYAGLFNSSVDL